MSTELIPSTAVQWGNFLVSLAPTLSIERREARACFPVTPYIAQNCRAAVIEERYSLASRDLGSNLAGSRQNKVKGQVDVSPSRGSVPVPEDKTDSPVFGPVAPFHSVVRVNQQTR